MTHAELVSRAARWLRNSRKCGVVFTETSAYHLNESPDAIGWDSRGASTLIECKVSVADFRADKHKPSRRTPERLSGRHRYYLTPPGLLRGESLPFSWGLLEVHPRNDDTIVRVITPCMPDPSPLDRRDTELALLTAELRRIAEGWRRPTDGNGLHVAEIQPEPLETP